MAVFALVSLTVLVNDFSVIVVLLLNKKLWKLIFEFNLLLASPDGNEKFSRENEGDEQGMITASVAFLTWLENGIKSNFSTPIMSPSNLQ